VTRRKTGFFITLEGPEGSGKSSQCRRLVRWLRRRGLKVLFVRDPGSTALGRALRRVLLHAEFSPSPLMEALLFIGGRVQLVEELISPALRKGRVVVCDRFHDSTVVYQGYAGGLDVGWLDAHGRRAVGNVMPKLTLALDISPKKGLARLRRSRDRMESKALEFHRRVHAGYRAIARREPGRVKRIDASVSEEAVWEQVERIVEGKLS
jgi:dTMP kinase